MPTDPGLDIFYKWMYYSTYHPSLSHEKVLLDWSSKKDLKQVYAEASLPWPPTEAMEVLPYEKQAGLASPAPSPPQVEE